MGRVSDKHSYHVKSTLVELPSAADSDLSRTMSDAGAINNSRPCDSPQPYIPQTPSPFLHPAAAPTVPPFMSVGQPFGSGCLQQGIAFGDLGSEGLNLGLQYAPAGAFVPYDFGFVAYDARCFGMLGQGQLQGDMHADQVPAQASNAPLQPSKGGCEGDMERWEGAPAECWEGAAWGHCAPMGADGYGEERQQGGALPQHLGKRRAERRSEREAARRQERTAAAAAGAEAPRASEVAHQAEGPAAFTTVMFRNIPNKYTREMLVKQLDETFRAEFDFVYLPIDFKNKCNVGYAFINFRTVETCQSFIDAFNGVEVWKCLPGLHSRKVTEVTPARVQGFEDNVQRLRNSPVMRELVHNPEWMPLIFDERGATLPFPQPERPLEPIKPRRRARDDEALRFQS